MFGILRKKTLPGKVNNSSSRIASIMCMSKSYMCYARADAQLLPHESYFHCHMDIACCMLHDAYSCTSNATQLLLYA